MRYLSEPTLLGALLFTAAGCSSTPSQGSTPQDAGTTLAPDTGLDFDADDTDETPKAVPGDVLWVYTFANEVPLAVAPVASGGVMWAGYAEADSDIINPATNAQAAGHLTSTGTSDWRDKSDGNDSQLSYVSVAALPNGSFVFAGENGNNAGTVHGTAIDVDTGFLSTRDVTGAYGSVTPLEWTAALQVVANTKGIVFVAGGNGGTPDNDCIESVNEVAQCPNAMLAAFDASGNMSWIDTYTGDYPVVQSPSTWPDGGVSAVVYYQTDKGPDAMGPQGIQGPGITETGNGTLIAKWNGDGTFAWSLAIPDQAVVVGTVVLENGTLVAAIDASSPITIGTLVSTKNSALLTIDATGTASAITPWAESIGVLAAVPSTNDVVVESRKCGAPACSTSSSLARVTSKGKTVWTTTFTVGGDDESYVTGLTVGSDGLAYMSFSGGGTFYDSDGYDFSIKGTTTTDDLGDPGYYDGSVVGIKL